MTEREKPDLSKIEPIGRPPDAAEEPGGTQEEAARIGRTGAAVYGAPPAVGVEAEVEERAKDAEPRTSPETEEELDKLRRG